MQDNTKIVAFIGVGMMVVLLIWNALEGNDAVEDAIRSAAIFVILVITAVGCAIVDELIKINQRLAQRSKPVQSEKQ